MTNSDKTIVIEAMRKAARCWAGYEPVPGAKAYSEGSCRPKGSKKTKKEVIQGKKHTEKKAQQPGAYYTGKYSQKPFNVDHARQHLNLPATMPDNAVYDHLIKQFEGNKFTPSQFSEFRGYYGGLRPRFRAATGGAPNTALAGPTSAPQSAAAQTASAQPPAPHPMQTTQNGVPALNVPRATPGVPAMPQPAKSPNDVEYDKWRATQQAPQPNTLSAAAQTKSGGVNVTDGLFAKLRAVANQHGFNAAPATPGPADPLPAPSRPQLSVARPAPAPLGQIAPPPLKRLPLPLQ